MKTKNIFLLFLVFAVAISQKNTIKGQIIDKKTGKPVYLANVSVKGKLIGAATDIDGYFVIENIKAEPPFTLEIHCIGYKQKAMNKVSFGDMGKISLKEEIYGETVVVTGSKYTESILESPTTIEKIDALAIKLTPAPSFYDGIGHLKDVDLVSSSIGMKTVNMRGFSSGTPNRMVQFIDGMDNQSPALSFPVSNLVGMSELDIESVEIIYGANSALYGANAFSGVISMNSKSPWDYPGLSVRLTGGERNYKEAVVRFAQTFDNTFAYKVNVSYISADDWVSDSFYESVKFPKSEGFGFREIDLYDPNAENLKLSLGLFYRFNDQSELSYNVNYGTGSTVYQGAHRFAIKNFSLQQHKVEWNRRFGKNYVNLKAYRIQDDAGDTYNIAHAAANLFAYKGTGVGSIENPNFDKAFKDVTTTVGTSSENFMGARIFDESSINHVEVQNSSEFFGVNYTVGASFRNFDPESNGSLFRDEGTVFTDDALGDITANEFGAYGQLIEKFIDNRLKVTLTGRFDKHENFDGQFSPGMSAVWSFKSDEEHENNGNLRFSIQKGYRAPTLQDQFIGLNLGQANLLSNDLAVFPDNVNAIIWGNYNGFDKDYAFPLDAVLAGASSVELVDEAQKSLPAVKPEQVLTWEVGYKSIIGDGFIFLDMNYYQNYYTDFIKSKIFLVGNNTKTVLDLENRDLDVYMVHSNFDKDVQSRGFAVSGIMNLTEKFTFNSNFTFSELTDMGGGDVSGSGFNTPRRKWNIGFSGRKLFGGNTGFNVNTKYADRFQWDGSGFSGRVPAYMVTDFAAFHNFRWADQMMTVKLAIKNIFNHKHIQGFGMPKIGRLGILQLSTDF
jgi:outer membrane receptor protein involved in Fe transport